MAIPKGNLVTPVGFNSASRPRALEVDSKDLLKIGIGGVSSISSKGISVSNLSLPTGSSSLYSDAVPSGKIWIVSSVSVRYIGSTASDIYVMMVLAGTAVMVFAQKPPSNAVSYDRQGWWILQPGDNILWGVSNATLNDDLNGYATICELDLNS